MRASLSPTSQFPGKLLLSITDSCCMMYSMVTSSHPSVGHFLCHRKHLLWDVQTSVCTRVVCGSHGSFPLQLLPITATSHYSYFPLQLLPVTATSRYSYFPLQLLPITATSRYSYFPLQLLPITATSRYSYFPLLLLPVTATSRYSYYCGSN